MPGNAHKDPPTSMFADPHLGSGLSIFLAGGEQGDLFGVSGEFPVAFVVELQAAEVAEDGVLGVLEVKGEWSVSEGDFAAPGSESDAFGEGVYLIISIDGPVDVDGTAAVVEEVIEAFGSWWREAAFLEEDEDIGLSEEFVAGEFADCGGFDSFGACEQFFPLRFPRGVIVFSGAMVFGTIDEDNVEWLGVVGGDAPGECSGNFGGGSDWWGGER